MPKRKPLPDHSPQSGLSSGCLPTESESEGLASKFNFPDSEKLRLGIKKAFVQWGICQRSQPPIKEQRELLAALQNRSKSLHDVVSKLGDVEISRLEELYGTDIDKLISSVLDDTDKLKSMSLITLSDMRHERDKRKKTPFWCFVLELADLWAIEIGGYPTCSYDGFEEKYVGKFYQFVVQCVSLGDIKMYKNEPGGTIKNILKEWRREKG